MAAISVLGSGVAVAATVEATNRALASPVSPADLLRPLAPGSRFGRWQLERVGALDHGAVTVVVRGTSGPFSLEVLKRDPSPWMPRAPGETAHFAVHVLNSGDGTSPTDEDHGLCAMTLASVIAQNEDPAIAEGFATLAHRLERRGA